MKLFFSIFIIFVVSCASNPENNKSNKYLSAKDEESVEKILGQNISKSVDLYPIPTTNIEVPKKDDICYATQNRQDAVKQLALESDYIIVVGSKNSSNSNRLKELAEKCGCKSILIDEFLDLDFNELKKYSNISITAGASAPESKVIEIANSLKKHLDANIKEHGQDNENIYFKMPPELR